MSELQRGWCEHEVQQELPELSLVCLRASPRLPSLTGASPRALRLRLRELSNRWRGARAVGVRQEPVPAAYRVFFRQIGLDPDVVKTPVEAAVLERMLDGGFLSRDAISDVLTIATMDTCVPVWALSAEELDGQLGVRLSREGERLGGTGDGWQLGAGRLVVADAERAVALLFGEISPRHLPRADTTAVTLFAIQVAGVPELHVEEALWSARQLLEGG
ncbi:MAG: phenylalanine--tRNA ligase beta subunit-related protein [Solirubrobacteraceae bacterium]